MLIAASARVLVGLEVFAGTEAIRYACAAKPGLWTLTCSGDAGLVAWAGCLAATAAVIVCVEVDTAVGGAAIVPSSIANRSRKGEVLYDLCGGNCRCGRWESCVHLISGIHESKIGLAHIESC